ncbi:unnamed protein product [Rhizophagus irregularis]|uniref:Zinc finger mym-type protein 2-like n=1 Tax=Rhizophagus irregularis TaxID=588596 RepID=A0A916E7R5_9GLOM|nr:unnamed protein product [Rhizophagus irregularis]CAB5368934.1 unnamed protein product [Rhizophagus irregularis]
MQTARGKATHNSTSTWINALETFRKDIGLPGKIDDQQNGAEYSVQSIKSARFAIARHINTYSKIRSQEITNKNIYSKLYNIITGKIKLLTDQGLALRGGEHYNLKIQQFKKRKDGGIDVTFYRSKCNQRFLSESNSKAEVISIPADNAVIQDYELYFSKRSPICKDAFYLQPCNNNEVEFTGYWFKSAQMGEKSVKGLMKEIATITEIDCDKRKFTNHSGRKTFIQISKSEGISDNDVMSVSQHKNPHSLAYYEYTLLSNDKTANSFSSALEIFNESRSPLQQLNSNNLNELNDDQQNQEINGNDETIKKILHGNVFQNCNITFNVNK